MREVEELEKIKQRKMRELTMRKSETEKPTSNKPVEVNDVTFEEFVKNPLVVVDCWAPWCGPCQMVAPVMEEMARDYTDKILFGKLNVDENQKVPTQYQIMSIPTLLVFKEGKLVDKIVGAMPREMLEPKITKHL